MAEEIENQIINPWIVIHQPGGNGEEMLTLLGGMEGANDVHFSIVIADLIQHVANHFNVDVLKVMHQIEEEMENPTTTLVNHKVQ